MKTVVIYNSQTGFTKRYAQWIAEATGGDCMELNEAKKDKTEQEEVMIKMISSSYDISDKKYIEPILECLK